MQQFHSAQRRERGLFVLAFATLFVVIGLGLVTHRLATADQGGPIRKERVTQDALRDAKLALLAFAADNRNRPGGLPCPDRDGDGEAELTCDRPEARVGWLPWQTLASGPLRDSSGELLWYALAAEYRNDPDIAINSATRGSVRMAQSHGTHDDLAAVVIAPGNAQSGQVRIRRNADNRDAFIESVTRADASGIELHLNGNDRIVPLATTELWQKVEPMVALRLVREIAPIIESQYAREWGALPYPAAFTDPALRGAVLPSPNPIVEGALPAITTDSVSWSNSSIALAKASGAGTLDAHDCRRSFASEIRCEVQYTGPVRIRIDARALGVGYALVAPPQPDDADFAPATLSGRSIEHGSLERDGSVRFVAYADLPAHSTIVRLQLHAPTRIRVLADPRIEVADPHSWFARNEWFRFTYLAVGAAHQPSATRGPCGVAGRCLRLANHRKLTEAPALLVFSGRARTGAGSLLARYFEGDNATPNDDSFDARPSLAGSNDRVIPLCLDNLCER